MVQSGLDEARRRKTSHFRAARSVCSFTDCKPFHRSEKRSAENRWVSCTRRLQATARSEHMNEGGQQREVLQLIANT
eukprot:2114458-Rhodomonas_salina.1